MPICAVCDSPDDPNPMTHTKGWLTVVKIPSGAIVFQKRHGWTVSSSASGNDMGIVRDRGRYTFNYKLMNPIIYSDAKEVVILVPK